MERSTRRVARSLASCLIIMTALTSFAQKLPDIQEKSMYAPPGLKIDGKATEWKGQFPAFNRTNLISYAVSNDDENLYLAIRSENNGMTAKILYGGLTFSVAASPLKGEKNKASVTFPEPQVGGLMSLISMSFGPPDRSSKKNEMSQKTADSIGFVLNRQQIDKLKNVILTGIKETRDTLSIFNENGILARALFDSKQAYTYELAIPLKFISSMINDQKELFYNLKFNGPSATRVLPINLRDLKIGGLDLMFLSNPSDFSGKYTLAKK